MRYTRVLAWRYFGLGKPTELLKFLVAGSAKAINRLATKPTSETKAHIKQLIDRFARQAPIQAKNGCPSVIITGYARSGKSLLAEKLAQAHGYHHIHLDMLTRLYYDIEDDQLRLYARLILLNSLLHRFPTGVVIEGDDLISRNRSRHRGMLPFSLATLEELQCGHDIFAYVVGNANASPEAKVESFRRFQETGRCWTSKRSHWNDLEARAREYISYNRELLILADRANIPFIEIDPADFEASLSDNALAITTRAHNW